MKRGGIVSRHRISGRYEKKGFQIFPNLEEKGGKRNGGGEDKYRKKNELMLDYCTCGVQVTEG